MGAVVTPIIGATFILSGSGATAGPSTMTPQALAAFRAHPDLVKRATAAGEEALAVVSARLPNLRPP